MKTIYPLVSKKAKKAHPVKLTSDGTKYRTYQDLLWFEVRIKLKNGKVFEGDVCSCDTLSEWLDNGVTEHYLGIDSGPVITRVNESEIEELIVLARPENDIGPFGQLPGTDDGYWDDDFITEEAKKEWGEE